MWKQSAGGFRTKVPDDAADPESETGPDLDGLAAEFWSIER